jgi:hypothetical protein
MTIAVVAPEYAPVPAYWATCRQRRTEGHSEANRQRVAPPGSAIKSEVAWCGVMR